MFALGDALLAEGLVSTTGRTPPDNLHSTVSNTNTGVIDEYLDDLAECVAAVVGAAPTTAAPPTPPSSDGHGRR